MGWRSYILPFHSTEEYNKIIAAIKEHNEHNECKECIGADAIRFRKEAYPDEEKLPEDYSDSEAGEELIELAKVPYKNLKIPGSIKEPSKKEAIMCANQGGSCYTLKFFERRNIKIYPYSYFRDLIDVEKREKIVL